MENKFTLRDFLVYVLTGFSVILFYLPMKSKECILFLLDYKDIIKDLGTLLLFFTILSLYILGHIIQGLDLIRYWVAKSILENKIKGNKFPKLFITILTENRVTGAIYSAGDTYDEFYKKVLYLQIKGKFGISDYFYSLKDLFHGIELVAFYFSIWSLFNSQFILFGTYLIFSIFFWFKAKIYSKEYVNSVNVAYKMEIENKI